MKTLILTSTFAACILTTKAQQFKLTPAKPLVKKQEPQWKKTFDDSLRIGKPGASRFSATVPAKTLKHPGRMPVAPTQNTDPQMPIVKTDRTGYKMPIAGKNDTTENKIARPDDRKKPR